MPFFSILCMLKSSVPQFGQVTLFLVLFNYIFLYDNNFNLITTVANFKDFMRIEVCMPTVLLIPQIFPFFTYSIAHAESRSSVKLNSRKYLLLASDFHFLILSISCIHRAKSICFSGLIIRPSISISSGNILIT